MLARERDLPPGLRKGAAGTVGGERAGISSVAGREGGDGCSSERDEGGGGFDCSNSNRQLWSCTPSMSPAPQHHEDKSLRSNWALRGQIELASWVPGTQGAREFHAPRRAIEAPNRVDGSILTGSKWSSVQLQLGFGRRDVGGCLRKEWRVVVRREDGLLGGFWSLTFKILWWSRGELMERL